MRKSFLFKSIRIPVTPSMHARLKKKRADGYSMSGYVRAVLEKALREDEQTAEEAG